MSVPHSLDPGTGPRALPDFTRGAAAVERMRRNLGPAATVRRADAAGRARVAVRPRVLLPAHPMRRTLVGAVVGGAGLAGAALTLGAGVWLALGARDGGSPSLVLLLGEAALALLALGLAALGARFALSGLAAARARVELHEHHLLVQGPLRARRVAWEDVVAVQARAVHPVHWLTVVLRLRDGSRVVLAALDRPLREHGRPSAEPVKVLRRELHRRRRGPAPRR